MRTPLPKRPLALMALAALLSPASRAQVSLYEFSQSIGTYTELTEEDGGVSLGVPAYWPHVYNSRAWVNNPFNDPGGQVTQGGAFNPAIGPGYPIGFPFTFNGEVFDVIGISNGGWVGFGKSTDGLQAVWVYNDSDSDPFAPTYNNPVPNYKRNRVAGFGNSGLQQVDWTSLVPPGQLSTLRQATIGTAPNRVCVIQWKDYGMRNDVTVSMNKINFQIRLYEADNSVEMVFGPMVWVSALGRHINTQSGLSGRTNADFNGRMTVYEQPSFLYDWNNTVAASTNLDGCKFAPAQTGQPDGSGIPPVLGLTWRWEPPACAPPAWPLTVGEITFGSAVAQWTPNAAGEYEYFVSTENSITGPEIASGTTTDPEAPIEGLEAGTLYYVFVRSICGGEPGVWSVSVPFETLRGGVVQCDGGVVLEEYCSDQFDVQEWLYISADGSPLKVEFLGGFVGSISGESFLVWVDGSPTSQQFTGDLTGQFAQSNITGQIRLRLTTDAGACHAQPWYLPLQWRIGCKNCTDPLVNFLVGTVDCAAQEYYVNADVFMMGTATSLVISNSLGLPNTTVNATGNHAIGPVPAGEPVVLLAQNPDNVLCYSPGPVLVNAPCAIQDCGPTWYERCGTPNDVREWLLQGDGQPISVRFPPVYMGWDADIIVYDGGDDMSPQFPTISGTATNQVYTSTNSSNMLLVRFEASTYGDYACSEGNTEPMRFVAECASACTPPQATFTLAECSTPASFDVLVDVTALGSASSVTISNDGGVPSVVVGTPGIHTVGPFASGSSVTLQVEGPSAMCSINSFVLSRDCSTMSIGDRSASTVRLFPNPNDGHFQLELPEGLSASGTLEVLDLAGRIVAQERLTGAGPVRVSLDLPSGLYSLLLRTPERTYTGRVSIEH